MAEFIVPQLEPFCKVQNNPKVNATIRQYSQSSDPYHKQCARILALGNDAAVDFLRQNGFNQVIPGTHFAPLYDMADFLDINADSLYAYLTRHGFGANHDPRESITEDLTSFFRRSGLIRYGRYVNGRASDSRPIEGVFDFRFTDTDVHYVTKYRYSGRMFTARAYLCVLPFIYRWYGRRNPSKKYSVIYEKLIRFVVEEAKKKEAAERAAAEAARKAADDADNASHQSTSLSKDELLNMIKQAVREVLADAKVEVPATFTITT